MEQNLKKHLLQRLHADHRAHGLFITISEQYCNMRSAQEHQFSVYSSMVNLLVSIFVRDSPHVRPVIDQIVAIGSRTARRSLDSGNNLFTLIINVIRALTTGHLRRPAPLQDCRYPTSWIAGRLFTPHQRHTHTISTRCSTFLNSGSPVTTAALCSTARRARSSPHRRC